MSKKIYILLPAYNEENSFGPLIKSLSDTLKAENRDFHIIVCNDGSSDNTNTVLDKLKGEYDFEVLTHKINRGLGETARDLFERAAEISDDDDYIVRLDADNTHEAQFILKMINKVDEGYDVVTASRFAEGGGQHGVHGYRAFISAAAQIFMKHMFGFKGMKEFSCGFRAYKASIIKKAINFYGNDFIQLKGLGFTGTLEKLLKLRMIGATFSEIGFQLRYDKKTSPSKMVSSITTLGYFAMAFLYHWPFGGWRTGYPKKIKKAML